MKLLFALFAFFWGSYATPVCAAAQVKDANSSELQILTLEEAINKALLSNPDLRSFSRNIQLADENIKLAESNYRPNISVTGDISHTRSDNNFLTNRDGVTSKSLALNFQQPLYRGGQTVAEVNEQNVLKDVTEEQLETLAQNLVIDVTQSYMSAYRAMLALNVNKNNVNVLSEELKATQARFEAGELTRTDTSQAQARLAEANAFFTDSEAIYSTAIADLMELTGITTIENLTYPQVEEAILPLTLNEALNVGIENNPTVRAAKKQILAQSFDIEQQEGAFLPQLSAAASAGYDNNPSFGQTDTQQSASVSLNATLPIYQAGILRSQLRQAKIRKDQASDDLESAKRAVTNNIISAWEEYKTVSARILARESQLEASNIAFEGVSLEEEVGARSILDVLDANQDVRDAELALIDAQRDRINAYYRLLGAIGLLRESFWDNSQTKL